LITTAGRVPFGGAHSRKDDEESWRRIEDVRDFIRTPSRPALKVTDDRRMLPTLVAAVPGCFGLVMFGVSFAAFKQRRRRTGVDRRLNSSKHDGEL
jgi:hypothetical protein